MNEVGSQGGAGGGSIKGRSAGGDVVKTTYKI